MTLEEGYPDGAAPGIDPVQTDRADSHGPWPPSPPLVGREKEAQALRAAFESARAGQAGLVLVSGSPGTGKTFLVNQTLKALASSRGYFIAGKFDQTQPKAPYAPLMGALGDLMRQFLTESAQALAAWKRRLRRALGGSGAVLAAVIPEVELVTGPWPPVEQLAPRESENRFRMVFRNFVRSLANRRHPLVILLDDLHWADQASCQMIRYLVDDADLRNLLLVGAYRGTAVSGTHPLHAALADMKKAGTPVRHIPLDTLDRSQTALLVAGTLPCPPSSATPLAEILYRKTGGNPFFLEQLLQSLRQEKLLALSPATNSWEWDPTVLERWPVAADVVDLMAAKLQNLPEATRTALKLASCLGHTFDLTTLAGIGGITPEQTAGDLSPALAEGLVLPGTGTPVPAPDAASVYEFLHDRVQEAAGSLLPEEERKQVHLCAGRLFLANAGPHEPSERLFRLTDHLNRGLDLITDPAEKIKLAGCNLAAGRKAKSGSAHAAALGYFEAGLQLLPDDAWDVHYQLTYDLFLERAQAEYLCGRFETAAELFDLLINRAGTAVERAGIHSVNMVLHTSMRKYPEALELGLKALRDLGLDLPPNPGKLTLIREILLTKWRLRGRHYENLLNLPEVNDPVQKKILEILVILAGAAYPVNPALYAYIICKGLNVSLRYGSSDFLGLACIAYSVVAANALGDYSGVTEAEKAAPIIAEKYTSNSARCVGNYLMGAYVSHWTKHGKASLDYLSKAYTYALAAGDLNFMAYALMRTLETRWFLGVPLKDIQKDCRTNHTLARQMKHQTLFVYATLFERIMTSLKGLSADFLTPKDGSSEDDAMYKVSNISMMVHCLFQMQLSYLGGRYTTTLAVAEEAQKNIQAIGGHIIYAEHNFYQSLAITAAYQDLPATKKEHYWGILRQNQKQMKKLAGLCPANFGPQYWLTAAETARLEGRDDTAAAWYDRAIQGCRENGCQQNEAIANELAGRFYLAHGRDKIARVYLADACRAFHRWGATGKTRALRNQHSRLLAGMTLEDGIAGRAESPAGAGPFSPDSPSPPDADLLPIRRATQLLSEETDPEQLLGSFLAIIIESAGADKGYLVLENAGKLGIKAWREGTGPPAVVTTPTRLERNTRIPGTVLRYVVRTLEAVVLNDTGQAGIFGRDPYFTQSPGKSIACLPLIFRGTPVAFLYLENSLVPGAFTPDRLKVLRLLAGQLAYLNKLHALLEENAVRTVDSAALLRPDLLTERELEVLTLVAAGLSNQEIAARLRVSLSTVKSHLLNTFGKLRVKRRTQAVSRAKELKLFRNS